MKRNISFWLMLPAAVGLLAFALMPALAHAQQSTPAAAPAAMGQIHGHVTNPTGEPQSGGEIGLSTDGGKTLKYTFPVNKEGNYSGKAPAGTYTVIYREKETPKGKAVDFIKGVKVVAGQNVAANLDMSRASYIAKLPAAEQKKLAELKKQNASAVQANKMINALNADLRKVGQDIKDAENARTTAMQQLGSSAKPAQVDAKAAQIAKAKYTAVEQMMTKDTGMKPDEPLLWTELGRAQLGLKKYDAAITSYKKALTLEQAKKKQNPAVLGTVYAGMGEAYARTGKVQEADQAFAGAVKSDPTRTAFYLRNEAVIFFQEHNGPAQVAAADEALKNDPNLPKDTKALLYYIKGQGLVQKATIDPKTQKIVLPPACAEAYENYLKLAPNGQFASEVKGILQQAGDK